MPASRICVAALDLGVEVNYRPHGFEADPGLDADGSDVVMVRRARSAVEGKLAPTRSDKTTTEAKTSDASSAESEAVRKAL